MSREDADAERWHTLPLPPADNALRIPAALKLGVQPVGLDLWVDESLDHFKRLRTSEFVRQRLTGYYGLNQRIFLDLKYRGARKELY